MGANVTLQGRTVRVQTIYHKEDEVAVRHAKKGALAILGWQFRYGRRISRSLWWKILKVALQWLNQTSDQVTYTPSDNCDGNSPKCILTRVVGYTGEGANITLSSGEDTRLCRLANGDLRSDDVEDVEDTEDVVDTAAELIEDEREVSLPRLPGVSLSVRTANYTL